jgi:hypothetical protein
LNKARKIQNLEPISDAGYDKVTIEFQPTTNQMKSHQGFNVIADDIAKIYDSSGDVIYDTGVPTTKSQLENFWLQTRRSVPDGKGGPDIYDGAGGLGDLWGSIGGAGDLWGDIKKKVSAAVPEPLKRGAKSLPETFKQFPSSLRETIGKIPFASTPTTPRPKPAPKVKYPTPPTRPATTPVPTIKPPTVSGAISTLEAPAPRPTIPVHTRAPLGPPNIAAPVHTLAPLGPPNIAAKAELKPVPRPYFRPPISAPATPMPHLRPELKPVPRPYFRPKPVPMPAPATPKYPIDVQVGPEGIDPGFGRPWPGDYKNPDPGFAMPWPEDYKDIDPGFAMPWPEDYKDIDPGFGRPVPMPEWPGGRYPMPEPRPAPMPEGPEGRYSMPDLTPPKPSDEGGYQGPQTSFIKPGAKPTPYGDYYDITLLSDPPIDVYRDGQGNVTRRVRGPMPDRSKREPTKSDISPAFSDLVQRIPEGGYQGPRGFIQRGTKPTEQGDYRAETIQTYPPIQVYRDAQGNVTRKVQGSRSEYPIGGRKADLEGSAPTPTTAPTTAPAPAPVPRPEWRPLIEQWSAPVPRPEWRPLIEQWSAPVPRPEWRPLIEQWSAPVPRPPTEQGDYPAETLRSDPPIQVYRDAQGRKTREVRIPRGTRADLTRWGALRNVSPA